MFEEIPRRSFFSLAAFSPLAWLGLRKAEPKDEPHPYPFYGTWKKCAEGWEKTARLRDADADHWEGRAETAEKKLDCMCRIPFDENRMKQLQELRKETA